MWIEIFKGGKQTDSNGRTHDGDTLIEAAVPTFNADQYKPPLVLGHPAMDSPAYGWINAVKSTVVNGVKTMLADVAPVEALKDWVNAGLYRNRSAAFYDDGRLRHLGFLGGNPPAVKGLAPLPAFSDGDSVVFTFSDQYQRGLIAQLFRKLREYFIEKDGLEKADRLIGDWEIAEIGRQEDEPDVAAEAAMTLYSQPNT